MRLGNSNINKIKLPVKTSVSITNDGYTRLTLNIEESCIIRWDANYEDISRIEGPGDMLILSPTDKHINLFSIGSIDDNIKTLSGNNVAIYSGQSTMLVYIDNMWVQVGTTSSYNLDGSIGEQGNNGTQGNAGDIGFTGIQGAQGFVGASFDGAQGAEGAKGQPGDPGAKGNKGPQGVQGSQGVQGDNGS